MTDRTDVELSPDAAEPLDRLQAENDALRQQLETLRAGADSDADDADRLAEQKRINDGLRKELASKALTEALRAAADEVGIDPDLAALQATRFTCTVDDTGRADVVPNPVETFLKLSKTDPLFRRADRAGKDRRDEPGPAPDAAAVNESDAVDLVAYLDRNPARRYEFIRRHGRERFFELVRTAKRRGYRAPGR